MKVFYISYMPHTGKSGTKFKFNSVSSPWPLLLDIRKSRAIRLGASWIGKSGAPDPRTRGQGGREDLPNASIFFTIRKSLYRGVGGGVRGESGDALNLLT